MAIKDFAIVKESRQVDAVPCRCQYLRHSLKTGVEGKGYESLYSLEYYLLVEPRTTLMGKNLLPQRKQIVSRKSAIPNQRNEQKGNILSNHFCARF